MLVKIVQKSIMIVVKLCVVHVPINVNIVILMVTVPNVELMLTQSQIFHVSLIISLICIKEEKFAKFVTSDVTTVVNYSTIVSTVP
jgi:hypothetical protein